MPPWEDLLARIAAALAGSPRMPSVLAGPQAQLVPDAILVRPDGPWISRGGADGRPVRFTGNLERYTAICVTRIADPGSAMEELYRMAQAVISAGSDAGWDWIDVGPMALDETTDTPLYVASVRLTYSG